MKRNYDEIDELRRETRRLRRALTEATMDLAALLRLRGFRIHSKQPSDDLLIPAPEHLDDFFETMKKYSFRLFLRDVIKHQQGFGMDNISRYSSPEVTEDYVKYMLDTGLLEIHEEAFRLPRRIMSFGATLEWFMAEILMREFGLEAVWGVKFKGQKAGGDYDLIAKVDGGLLYMEVKSSPPKQVSESEIVGFLDRAEDLNPDLSVFLMDTELRMKDKIVPMFDEELGRRQPGGDQKFNRIVMELFHISGGIYIINAKHSIPGNIEKVLHHHFRGPKRR
jgi:hypothetical protein